MQTLRNLSIEGWAFDEEIYTCDVRTTVEILVEGLKARREKGVILSKLTVHGCYHVEEKAVEKLRAVVEPDGVPYVGQISCQTQWPE